MIVRLSLLLETTEKSLIVIPEKLCSINGEKWGEKNFSYFLATH